MDRTGDRVFLRGLKVETVVGVHAWERRLPRPLELDLELATDARRAAQSDALRDALDYQAVADELRAFAAQARFQLIETFAERAAALLQSRFGVSWLRLTVRKPGAVAGVDSLGVTIERATA